jgi:hypothetical protein
MLWPTENIDQFIENFVGICRENGNFDGEFALAIFAVNFSIHSWMTNAWLIYWLQNYFHSFHFEPVVQIFWCQFIFHHSQHFDHQQNYYFAYNKATILRQKLRGKEPILLGGMHGKHRPFLESKETKRTKCARKCVGINGFGHFILFY